MQRVCVSAFVSVRALCVRVRARVRASRSYRFSRKVHAQWLKQPRMQNAPARHDPWQICGPLGPYAWPR
eukprot:13160865-Alexandrium_andersonii.AAC.1